MFEIIDILLFKCIFNKKLQVPKGFFIDLLEMSFTILLLNLAKFLGGKYQFL